MWKKENDYSMALINHTRTKYLNYLNIVCSNHCKVYDNFMFINDFNVAMSDKVMEDLNNLEILTKKQHFLKSQENLTCIKLLLIKRSIQKIITHLKDWYLSYSFTTCHRTQNHSSSKKKDYQTFQNVTIVMMLPGSPLNNMT